MSTRTLSLSLCVAASFACASTPPTQESTGGGAGSDTGKARSCGPGAVTGVRVGDCAPEFSLPDRNEVAFSLHAQRGKVALVDISAIW